jgi:hypothetical protein
MGFLDQRQTKEIANFLTTTSVAWFSAGVIAPFFTTPINSGVFILSIIFGVCMTIFFLFLSVTMIKER